MMMRTAINHFLKYAYYKINGKMLGFECSYFFFIHPHNSFNKCWTEYKINKIYKLTVFDSIHELLPICYKPMVFHVTKFINTLAWTLNMTSTYKSLDIIQFWDITFTLFHLYQLTKHQLIGTYNDKFHWKLTSRGKSEANNIIDSIVSGMCAHVHNFECVCKSKEEH